jgi:hypothetical protein
VRLRELDHRDGFEHQIQEHERCLMSGVKFCPFSSGRDGASAYIVCMDTILPILLGLAMLATLGVLCAGVIAFAFNTKVNAKYSNKLMTARVVCQAVAVAIFGLMVFLHLI